MEHTYWMVHNPNNRQPYKMHTTRTAATSEAARLAKEKIGEKFYVLESVSCLVVRTPEPVEILTEPAPHNADDC